MTNLSSRPRPVLLGALTLAIIASGCSAEEPMSPPSEPLDRAAYPWLAEEHDRRELAPLGDRFPPPDGYQRSPGVPGSWSSWLRGLPVIVGHLRPALFSGATSHRRAAAVIALDVGHRDLQQCADTWLRLHAEYLWATGHADRAAYHLTSGDLVSWNDWTAGERLLVDSAKVARRRGPSRPADHASFRAWLDQVFIYAGTRSLHRDAIHPTDGPILPGDAFVSPGSPGHAIIVLDTVRDQHGTTLGLLAEGYMPAQELSVIAGSSLDDVWFTLPADEDELLTVPTWPTPFRRADLLRLAIP